jgi:hypothetical protein
VTIDKNKTEVVTAELYTENGLWYTVSRDKHTYEQRKSDPTSGTWITLSGGSRFRHPTDYLIREVGIKDGTPYLQRGDTGPPNYARRDVQFKPTGYADDVLLTSLCPPFPGNVVQQVVVGSPIFFPTEMMNEANTKALNKIADQKANISEDLATFRQTISLFKNPSESLWKSLKEAWTDKTMRPFLTRSLRDIKRDGPLVPAARKYLEYVYGWRPLMQDIFGVYLLAKQQSVAAMLMHGSGVSRRSLGGGNGSFYDFNNATTTQWTSTTEDAIAICKLWARIDPNHAGLRTLNQLGLANPLSLVWELVSWSFVVDWFVPIGPVLNALTAPAGLSFVSGSRSVKSTMTGTYEHWRDPWNYMRSESRATGTAFSNTYARQRIYDWPLPGTWFVDNPFTQDHTLKALALHIMNLHALKRAGR